MLVTLKKNRTTDTRIIRTLWDRRLFGSETIPGDGADWTVAWSFVEDSKGFIST